MNIIRYHTPEVSNAAFAPLARRRALQHPLDRLFEFPFVGTNMPLHAGAPALDLYEDGDNFTVTAEMPGLKREDIQLSLQDGILTLSGERRAEQKNEEKGSLRNERYFGKFERSISLPEQVDGTRVTASYEDGVLTVVLPKAEAAKPRQIEIQAPAQQKN